eukprot:349898-Chlamydomonas_euryale.AAC.8
MRLAPLALTWGDVRGHALQSPGRRVRLTGWTQFGYACVRYGKHYSVPFCKLRATRLAKGTSGCSIGCSILQGAPRMPDMKPTQNCNSTCVKIRSTSVVVSVLSRSPESRHTCSTEQGKSLHGLSVQSAMRHLRWSACSCCGDESASSCQGGSRKMEAGGIWPCVAMQPRMHFESQT